jgi:hypothetical protein
MFTLLEQRGVGTTEELRQGGLGRSEGGCDRRHFEKERAVVKVMYLSSPQAPEVRVIASSLAPTSPMLLKLMFSTSSDVTAGRQGARQATVTIATVARLERTSTGLVLVAMDA